MKIYCKDDTEFDECISEQIDKFLDGESSVTQVHMNRNADNTIYISVNEL